jgi:hypothetical protein
LGHLRLQRQPHDHRCHLPRQHQRRSVLSVHPPTLRDSAGWRARLIRELPLILGLLLGLGFLLHPGFVRFGYPHGADWDTYLASAAHLWLDPELFRYNEWRQPLYPWLVGLLGGGGSYVLVAQWLALGSSLGTVLGSGLLARALAGPWAAGLAAVATAWIGVVVDGSWWVNPYPLVGALTALALAAAVWCARWPGGLPALLAGSLGGLCIAMDPRGLSVALAVPLLVALAPLRWRPRFLLVALATAGIALGLGLDRGLQAQYGLELRSVHSQLELQSQEGRGPGARRVEVASTERELCSREPGREGGKRLLAGPCARQRLGLNLRTLREDSHLPPLVPLAGLLLLCLLPGSWGRRSSLATGLVFWPSALALLLGMALVPYTDRYLLPAAALLGCLGPVALVRAGGLLARRWPAWPRLVVTGPALAALWVLFVFPGIQPGDLVDPTGHIARRPTEQPAPVDARSALAEWAVQQVGPDDLLLDCAELHLSILLLPRELPVWDAPPHDHMCHVRMKAPPSDVDGTLWLLTVHQRGRRPDPSLKSPAWVEARGWQEQPLELDIPEGTHAATIASRLRRWRWPD